MLPLRHRIVAAVVLTTRQHLAMLRVAAQSRQRVAALDLGTNSFHLLISDVFADGTTAVVDRLKEMVGLGRDGLHHHLDPTALDRAMSALRRIKLLCDHQGVELILAYATSAIREAANGGELLRRAHHELGIAARAIPGTFEAELIALAVQHGLPLGPNPSLLVDVGGGSIELALVDRERVRWRDSRKIGVARLAAGFLRADRLSEVDERRLEAFLERELVDTERAIAAEGGVTELIGTSGTIEAVAAMVAARYGHEVRNGYQLAAAEVSDLYQRLRRLDRAGRLTVPGLDHRRVDYIVPGLALLEVLIRRNGITQLRVSRHALREGMLLHHVRQQGSTLGLLAAFPNPRRRAVHELARRFGWQEPHSQQVARLALALFDATTALHGLGQEDRELLDYAALLHDIGYVVNFRDHHRHASYLIRHAEPAGFAPEEVEVLALLARYHRGSPPPHPAKAGTGSAGRGKHRDKKAEKGDRAFRKLPAAAQQRVHALAAFLRVADGLDRSHYQNVRELSVTVRRRKVVVELTTLADPEVEIWGGQRRCELLAEVLDRRVEICAAPVAAAAAPADTADLATERLAERAS